MPQINEGQTEERTLKTDKNDDKIIVNSQVSCPYVSEDKRLTKYWNMLIIVKNIIKYFI